MKTKKKNIFIIILLIIVVLPVLLSFVKCDNSADPVTAETRTQHEINYSRQVKRANNTIWSGTAIPNTGILTGLYINTNLNNEQVNNIIESVAEDLGGGFTAYPVLYAVNQEEETIDILIGKNEGEYLMMLNDNEVSRLIYHSSSGFDLNQMQAAGYINNDVISLFNFTLINELEGMQVGTKNNQITSLFSLTPFVELDNKTGLQILFEEIGEGLSGLAAAFISLFNGIVPVFWVNNQPTIISILVLAGVVLTIGFWGIDKLLKLFKIGLGGKKWKN